MEAIETAAALAATTFSVTESDICTLYDRPVSGE